MRALSRWSPDEGINKIDVLKIEPSNLKGSLLLPPSKSHAMRWLILASMDPTPTSIEMSEIGDDVQAMIDCLQRLGIEWNDGLVIGGELQRPISVLNCVNSGTAFRFLLAQAATCDFPIMLDGDESLRARNSSLLLEALGVKVSKGFGRENAPVLIQGPFAKESVEVDTSKSSQYYSAIMLMAPRTKGFDLQTSGEAVSTHHSDLTWRLCQETGATKQGFHWQVDCPDVVIPPDPSMAAFAKLAGLEIANSPSLEDGIAHSLDSTDLSNSNDLITPMAAWLAMGDGGVITGAAHAAHKESNRITKTVELLSDFGMKADATTDGLVVEGGQIPSRPNGVVKTHGDHRIQMTAVLLAARCGGVIEGSRLNEVAWPSYLEQLEMCGLRLKREIIQP